jgi:hypothetical protein
VYQTGDVLQRGDDFGAVLEVMDGVRKAAQASKDETPGLKSGTPTKYL